MSRGMKRPAGETAGLTQLVWPFGDNPSVSFADSSPFRGAKDV